MYVEMPSTSGKHFGVCAALSFSAGRADLVLLASYGSTALHKGEDSACGPSPVLIKAQRSAI